MVYIENRFNNQYKFSYTHYDILLLLEKGGRKTVIFRYQVVIGGIGTVLLVIG